MSLQGINILDAILVAAIVISALVGIARGLVKEILSMVAWVIALWLAYTFADQLATSLVQKFIPDKLISYIAAFGCIFLGGLFAIGLLNMLITSLLSAVKMAGFDRFLGMLFGIARGAVLCALLVFFGAFVPALTQENVWRQSKLMPSFMNLANWGVAKLPANIRDLIKQQDKNKSQNMLDQQIDDIDEMQTTDDQNSSSANLPIQLQSITSQPAQDLGSATRPQISTQQQEKQKSQSDTLSNTSNNGVTLESLDSDSATPQSVSPPAENNQAPSPLSLESTK